MFRIPLIKDRLAFHLFLVIILVSTAFVWIAKTPLQVLLLTITQGVLTWVFVLDYGRPLLRQAKQAMQEKKFTPVLLFSVSMLVALLWSTIMIRSTYHTYFAIAALLAYVGTIAPPTSERKMERYITYFTIGVLLFAAFTFITRAFSLGSFAQAFRVVSEVLVVATPITLLQIRSRWEFFFSVVYALIGILLATSGLMTTSGALFLLFLTGITFFAHRFGKRMPQKTT